MKSDWNWNFIQIENGGGHQVCKEGIICGGYSDMFSSVYYISSQPNETFWNETSAIVTLMVWPKSGSDCVIEWHWSAKLYHVLSKWSVDWSKTFVPSLFLQIIFPNWLASEEESSGPDMYKWVRFILQQIDIQLADWDPPWIG